MTAIRIGVVGAGAVAQIAHLPVLARMEEVEIVAICDNDQPKARSLATRFGVADVFDDIEDLLRYSEPDAVTLCTPNHLHEVHTMTALSAGAHVLCERPLALSAGGVEEIRRAARSSGKVVQVGMNHRFRRDVQAVRLFIDGGELGDLHALRGGWYTFRPARYALGWRRRRQESGGGAMLDLGLPLIDLALWMAGCPTPRSVTASFARRDAGALVEDTGCALLTCDRDLSVFVDVSWRHVGPAESIWFTVLGSRGSAAINPLAVYKEMHSAPVNVTPTGALGHENEYTASFHAQWAHFAATVRGYVDQPDLDDQITLHRVMDAVSRSAQTDCSIELE